MVSQNGSNPDRMPRASWIQGAKFLGMAGVGFFADGYLNITIGLVVPVLGYIYYKDQKNAVPTVPASVIKGGLSIGMIVGQLVFGVLGDAIGRKKIYGKELMITMFGTLMVIVLPTDLSHDGIVAWLTVWRIVTGVGIGADYPMSSTISAEHNPFGSRGKLVLAVFGSQGVGNLAAGIVFLVLLVAFKSSIAQDVNRLEWVWRLLLGIGIIPAAATLYARLRMRESVPYQKCEFNINVEHKGDGSRMEDAPRGLRQQWVDFKEYFSDIRHAKILFATSACWFLFDIAFYGINLNQSIILSQIGFGKGKTTWDTLHKLAIGNIIASAAGYLPGYYAAIPPIDILGRTRQQFIGCITLTCLYAIWAGVANIAPSGVLITIFTLSQFFLNCGGSATTFLIPVEVFPTRVRSTAHGISAASGKAGAVLTAFAFGSVTNAIGIRGVLGILSGVIFLVALLTLMIPETKGKTWKRSKMESCMARQLVTSLLRTSYLWLISPQLLDHLTKPTL
ncbi:MFS inorganic phosphate transporter [Mollisia scopiformis]|uniref:MFS inorganic phosphate transporter n=1 Tax=Mollisia scopiformis TaxID=149040 RepID=A0A132BCR0_MOLSC|nr:MFS inorganic phosphate transporter [Mollisia scopiformis]KUJ10168.1 MFS inorganic phosphate transporter [Mollisia scopiformis]